MSWKDLFVKEDDGVPTLVSEPIKKGSTRPIQSPTSIGTTPTQFTTVGISASEKNEFSEFLNGVYVKGNFPGPDYQEFTDALKESESTPMDEKTRFTTIFFGFKVQGVTKTRLIDTGNKYITMINEQVSGFNKAIDETLSSEVVTKQNKVNQISKENDEVEKQMLLLTEKKNKNNELIQNLTSEINEQVTALDVKKRSFSQAATEFTSKIQSTIDKIKTYLPDTK